MLHDPRHPDPGASPAVLAVADTDITIRALTSLAEYKACVALQDEVWGKNYGDSVPASLLQVVTLMGGIAAGAFTAEGELIGFVFGLTGVKDGEVAHWSHALGVRESARNAGVGRMLKEYQRSELARRGVSTVYWTFDPLMAKNAHLNLNLLGAQVVEYVEDMYGTTGSPLHHGLATDRLVVAWSTTADPDQPATAARPMVHEGGKYPMLTPGARPDDVVLAPDDPERPPVLLIEIPADIQRVIATAPATAEAWHASIRKHFQWALRNGYSATGLHRDPMTARSFYVLERDTKTPR